MKRFFSNRYSVRKRRALTLIEVVVAMAIMAVVFAALLPQFRQIQLGWDTKTANAEIVQNGRILMDFLNRNLAGAVRVVSVSSPSENRGYIDYEGADGVVYRFDIGANDYVRFGAADGQLSELAGPVSGLLFRCYDAYDIDTTTTQADQIRFVRVDATLTSPDGQGRPMDFTTSAYIYTNSGGTAEITSGTPLEIDTSNGQFQAIAGIDSLHYLNVYTGSGSDGWAVVLTANTGNMSITKGVPFRFDSTSCTYSAIVRIDSTHYLCTYGSASNLGKAVVLTVNPSNWTISKGTGYTFDSTRGLTPAVKIIDSTHYLLAYQGSGSDGYAAVLTVNPSDWSITTEQQFEFELSSLTVPSLEQIDTTNYICAYQGPGSDGWATVLTVNPSNWQITRGSLFEFDTSNGLTPALSRLDSSRYLCAYTGQGNRGTACVLTVNMANRTISKGQPFVFENTLGQTPELVKVDDKTFLCAYRTSGNRGYAVLLTVSTDTNMVTMGTPFNFDGGFSGDIIPAMVGIDEQYYLCAYTGPGNDGYAVILKIDNQIKP